MYDENKNGFGLSAGQKYTGYVDVSACWYNGTAEITAWTPAADVEKEENVDIPVKTVTLANLNGSDYSKYECVRVKVENATVTTAYSTAKKATIKQGEETYLIHGEVNGLKVTKDDVYDFVGYPIYWKTADLDEHQLAVCSQDDIIEKEATSDTLNLLYTMVRIAKYILNDGVSLKQIIELGMILRKITNKYEGHYQLDIDNIERQT